MGNDLRGVAVPRQCADTSPIPATAPRHNVWKNFDVEEATVIRDGLWTYKGSDGFGFNLTTGTVATDFDNSIILVENFAPPKADVLGYFDGDGASPRRFAKILIALGGVSPPAFGQYHLGLLPSPISKLSLGAASLELKPLKHIYTSPDVPYTARLYPLTGTYTKKNSSGGTVGARAGTAQDNSDLVFGGSTPFSYDGWFRRIWFQLKKNAPGSWLMALDMYFYVDVTSMDPSEWYLIRMVYNRQVFATTEEFLEAYPNGTLKRSSPPETPGAGEQSWSGRERRGRKRDLDERAGPRQVSFNGLRYRVNKDNQWVTWMGWAFYLSFARDMGMSLWDVRFHGERILYEVSPQEALAVYCNNAFISSHVLWFEVLTVLSQRAVTPTRGAPCSWTAVSAHCCNRTPSVRHTGYMKGEMGISAACTVGNYDYLFDYTFQLDGTMEVRVSASGYLQGAWWDDAEMSYGTKIRAILGSLHDHVVNYKFDFDVAGTRNSLMAVSLENEVVEQPWFDDWGQDVHQQKLVRTMIRNESDALLDYPQNYQGVYAIVNEEKLDRWGYPRGYAIHPGVSPIHLTNLDSKRTRNNVNFAKHHLAVSRRKDSEPSSSSMWNINLPGVPHAESLEQEDLTAWVNLGMHHIPRAEDSLLLTPMNAILINVPEPGEAWSGDENGVEIEYCSPPRVDKFNYNGLTTFEEDGTPGQPQRVHKMRQQATTPYFAATEL
ncbi:amine oxidase catalytic domain-containing protein [Mycena olivaceomarginata]|nr:amine oxidase catalytic domain-containing protein [Mycena olivaceomarginata]